MRTAFTDQDRFPMSSYAHMVEVTEGSLIFTAGGIPFDADGELVGDADYLGQAAQVVENLRAVLEARSLTFDNIVMSTVYVNASDQPRLMEVWKFLMTTGITSSDRAATMIGVAALGMPGQLVEIHLICSREELASPAA